MKRIKAYTQPTILISGNKLRTMRLERACATVKDLVDACKDSSHPISGRTLARIEASEGLRIRKKTFEAIYEGLVKLLGGNFDKDELMLIPPFTLGAEKLLPKV